MPGDIPDIRFRLPNTFELVPEIVVDDGPAKGLLIGQNAPKDTFEAVFLGKHAEAPHRGVWLDTRGAHAVYVMGKRRSGKSYTLGALAEGLVSATWLRQGSSQPAVIILDSMNVFLTMSFGVAETFRFAVLQAATGRHLDDPQPPPVRAQRFNLQSSIIIILRARRG